MICYPKIETLYVRDEKTFKVIPNQLRMPESGLIKEWYVTEKVDGMNVRVGLKNDQITFGGKTDNAQMPVPLMTYLSEVFTLDAMNETFPGRGDAEVVLFGEGYGEKIQKGGGNYRKGVSFRLFDVNVGGLWLEPGAIDDVAEKLGIKTVPFVGFLRDHSLPIRVGARISFRTSMLEAWSRVSTEDGGLGCAAEGIVARTSPMLLTRRGERVMWKLKFKDF